MTWPMQRSAWSLSTLARLMRLRPVRRRSWSCHCFIGGLPASLRILAMIPLSSFLALKAKKELNGIIAKIRKEAGRPPMKQWQLHDLRRTGRSLMSRARVDSDHAERCMGHVIRGVRATYHQLEN